MDSRNYFLGSRSVPGLKLSAVSTASTTVAIPPAVPPGAYYVVAVVDSGGVVQESDKTNNSMAKPITIYGYLPDLIGVSVAGPATAHVGQTIRITSSIRNQGFATARNFWSGMYLSTSTTISPTDTLLVERWVSA